MPFIISLLTGLVSSTVIKALLTRAVVALGFAAVTYTGISVAFSHFGDMIGSSMGAVTGGAAVFLSMCHVPQALNVILSSYTGALALRGLTSLGAVTKVGISSAPGAVFSPGTF